MIYNGPSIYKFGGGGGGYKDGGELVDGDFIKIENNTISSYDNVSRDPVNFYLDLKDGEIANSVVELTTGVNSTINVYVLKNGFYYLLGNVGGNTVNAGEQYNLNVIGDSYALDQITTPSNDPKFVTIKGQIYGLAKIGGLLWTTENLRWIPDLNYNLISDGTDLQTTDQILNYTPDSITTRGEVYYRGTILSQINDFSNFRVPTQSDINKIKDNTISSLTSPENGGDNSTGFSAKLKGKCSAFFSSYPLKVRYSYKPNYVGGAATWAFWSTYDRYFLMCNVSDLSLKPNYTHQGSTAELNSDYFNVRLCMDA